MKHLSFSSLRRLQKDQKDFYKKNIMGIREPFRNKNFVIGQVIHKWIEEFHKGEREVGEEILWLEDIEDNRSDIYSIIKPFVDQRLQLRRDDYLDSLEEWDKPKGRSKSKYKTQVKKGIINYLKARPSKPLHSEYNFYVAIDDCDVKLKGYIDAVYENYLLDYKTIRAFSNFNRYSGEKKLKTYWWQGLFYCLGRNIENPDNQIHTAKYLEIKKTKPKTTDCYRYIQFTYNDEDYSHGKKLFKNSVQLAKSLKQDNLVESFESTENIPDFTIL